MPAVEVVDVMADGDQPPAGTHGSDAVGQRRLELGGRQLEIGDDHQIDGVGRL